MWSLTVYDRATHTVLQGSDRLGRSSLNTDLVTNEDGTVDLNFGPQAPPGQDGNWIPTTQGTGFEVMFRLYGPQPAFSDKTWALPDVRRLSWGTPPLGPANPAEGDEARGGTRGRTAPAPAGAARSGWGTGAARAQTVRPGAGRAETRRPVTLGP